MTFSDAAVRDALGRDYVCFWENQVPGMYRQAPPETSFPREMVDTCPEGAGGFNVQHFLCSPDGTVRDYFTGYWKPARFLAELGPHDHAGDPSDTPQARKVRDHFIRIHGEGAEFRGRPIADVLRQIAEEVYTKGRTG